MSRPLQTEFKRCPRCGEHKPLDAFPFDRKGPGGRYGYCRACKAAYMRRYPDTLAEGRAAWTRRRNLARSYGLTIEAFDALLASQDGCAICHTTDPRRWCVDHDHETGAVRGILCDPCNQAIGFMRDDPARLEAAAKYLRGG